eukprot:scaffold120696_cov24-Phaeocystis_antarctica.AAC.1
MRKSRPAIVCGSRLAAGMQNGTTTLPSGIEQQLSKPGRRVVSSGSSSFSGMPTSPFCSRMRKSCLQHSMRPSKTGTRESRQMASGACTVGRLAPVPSLGASSSCSRKASETARGSSSYHTMQAQYMRDLDSGGGVWRVEGTSGEEERESLEKRRESLARRRESGEDEGASDLSSAVSTNDVTTGMALAIASSCVTSRTPWGKVNIASPLHRPPASPGRFSRGSRMRVLGSNVVPKSAASTLPEPALPSATSFSRTPTSV